MRLPSKIRIREVSPRDGLQGEATLLSTEDKVRLVDMLSAAGFARINVTAFVSPKAVPQMADAATVMGGIARRPGTVYDASVPNLIGAQRAVAAKADAISIFVGASELGNRREVNRTIDQSMAGAEQAIAVAREAGLGVIGTIASAFGCPYEGTVPVDRVLDLARRFVSAGVSSLALGDTSGEGTPRQVADLVARVLDTCPGTDVALHLHDTRGLALANVLAAMDAGATTFDSAVGGIGGSPFIKNASGNTATEDLVHMCDDMGIESGVDLDAVLEAYRFLEDRLGHALPGRVGRFGRSKTAVHD